MLGASGINQPGFAKGKAPAERRGDGGLDTPAPTRRIEPSRKEPQGGGGGGKGRRCGGRRGA